MSPTSLMEQRQTPEPPEGWLAQANTVDNRSRFSWRMSMSR